MKNFYNSTKFINVTRVKKEAIYPVYFTGNIADSDAAHRKPRKNPVLLMVKLKENTNSLQHLKQTQTQVMEELTLLRRNYIEMC